jgi:hypothetical protein
VPASEVSVVVDPDPPHRIRVRGRASERMLYGPKLAPGASHAMTLDVAIHAGADRITAIQAGRPTAVDERPVKGE